ncbi:MAG TPA: PilW family protein [Dyella sp.]|uniref:PilW family protein n=1 Tax=Dyella sp. TaxID=1869338 RepID=UPI002D7724A6|nr:PilW family protein [Dyella sp.]HET6553361.1 PilW family protein [Dyella sp.]
MSARASVARQAGVSLIELMVAMVLGLLVAAGIINVFLSTSSSYRAHNQLAQVQETGRYAVERMAEDLRMANAQFCTGTGGIASEGGAGIYLDGLRAPVVYARNLAAAINTKDLTTRWGQTSGSNTYPQAPTAPYALPSFLWMRGYDCDEKNCKPVTPPTSFLPAMGRQADNRVVGSGVLTLRYVDPARGWTLGGGSYVVTEPTSGAVTSIHVAPSAGEPALSEFESAHLALLADCSGSQVFAVNGNPDFVPDANLNFAAPVVRHAKSPLRLFDFNTDFVVVTYYLKVIANDDGTTTGALIRKDKGSDQEIVRGVERLDFLYGVEDNNGNTRYLSAGEVDSNAGGSIACPPPAPLPLPTDPGCLWRAIKSIEVHLLVSAEMPLYTLTPSEQMFAYQLDGIAEPAAPDAPGRRVTPRAQGFLSQKVRREFVALVSVRNYNP